MDWRWRRSMYTVSFPQATAQLPLLHASTFGTEKWAQRFLRPSGARASPRGVCHRTCAFWPETAAPFLCAPCYFWQIVWRCGADERYALSHTATCLLALRHTYAFCFDAIGCHPADYPEISETCMAYMQPYPTYTRPAVAIPAGHRSASAFAHKYFRY